MRSDLGKLICPHQLNAQFHQHLDRKRSVQLENSAIRGFDCSVFTGKYITGDITPEYLDKIASQRNDSAKKKREKQASNLEIYNEQ